FNVVLHCGPLSIAPWRTNLSGRFLDQEAGDEACSCDDSACRHLRMACGPRAESFGCCCTLSVEADPMDHAFSAWRALGCGCAHRRTASQRTSEATGPRR